MDVVRGGEEDEEGNEDDGENKEEEVEASAAAAVGRVVAMDEDSTKEARVAWRCGLAAAGVLYLLR